MTRRAEQPPLFRVYTRDGEGPSGRDETGAAPWRIVIWRPTLRQPVPPADPRPALAAWSLLHFLGVFANREYGQVQLFDGDRLVHRAGIFPGFGRFPFMGPQDLQVGDTWTDPEYRGRGLATLAIRTVVERLGRPDRTFWYITAADNVGSVRAVERAGFTLTAGSVRTRRLGLRVLGAFILAPGAGAAGEPTTSDSSPACIPS